MLSRSRPLPRWKSGDRPPPIAFVSLAPHFAASLSSDGLRFDRGLGAEPGRSARLSVTALAKLAALAAVKGSGTATRGASCFASGPAAGPAAPRSAPATRALRAGVVALRFRSARPHPLSAIDAASTAAPPVCVRRSSRRDTLAHPRAVGAGQQTGKRVDRREGPRQGARADLQAPLPGGCISQAVNARAAREVHVRLRGPVWVQPPEVPRQRRPGSVQAARLSPSTSAPFGLRIARGARDAPEHPT